jgi:hypothetical protein
VARDFCCFCDSIFTNISLKDARGDVEEQNQKEKYMRKFNAIRSVGQIIGVAAVAALFAASSASASVVWDLNPGNQEAGVGSNHYTFTSQGHEITARGYDNNGGQGTGAELFFKNEAMSGGAIETGLGLANSAHHELNAGSPDPLNFIQLDLRSILSMGATNGMIAVASLQDGEGFQLFGSDTQGVLGTAISGAFTGLGFDDQFVAIPNFGTYDFISIVAATGNVLPSQFSADFAPVPEVGALFPILALLGAIGATTLLRRRAAMA